MFCHLFSHIVFLHVLSDVIYYLAIFSLASLLLFPCTRIFIIFLVVSSPSFLNTWSYHGSCFCPRKVVIGSMLASLKISLFLMVSYNCLASNPSQHSHISGVQFLGIFFLTAQHSHPYVIAGFIMFFLDFIFDRDRHLLIAHDSATSLHLAQAAFNLSFTSVDL